MKLETFKHCKIHSLKKWLLRNYSFCLCKWNWKRPNIAKYTVSEKRLLRNYSFCLRKWNWKRSNIAKYTVWKKWLLRNYSFCLRKWEWHRSKPCNSLCFDAFQIQNRSKRFIFPAFWWIWRSGQKSPGPDSVLTDCRRPPWEPLRQWLGRRILGHIALGSLFEPFWCHIWTNLGVQMHAQDLPKRYRNNRYFRKHFWNIYMATDL